MSEIFLMLIRVQLWRASGGNKTYLNIKMQGWRTELVLVLQWCTRVLSWIFSLSSLQAKWSGISQVSFSNAVIKDLSNSSNIQIHSPGKEKTYLELPKPASQDHHIIVFSLQLFDFPCVVNSSAMFLLVQNMVVGT